MKKSVYYVKIKMIWDHTFSVSNQGQARALKIAYISKVFGAQSFDQVTYVCEKYSNFQDLKSIFMNSDFKIFPIMISRQLNFGILLG